MLLLLHGRVVKWSKTAVCKTAIRRFESDRGLQFISSTFAQDWQSQILRSVSQRRRAALNKEETILYGEPLDVYSRQQRYNDLEFVLEMKIPPKSKMSYVLDKPQDKRIFRKLNKLAKTKAVKNERLLRLLYSQLETDWRTPLEKFIDKLLE